MAPQLRRFLDAALVVLALTGLGIGLWLRSTSHRDGPARVASTPAEASIAPRLREPTPFAGTAELRLVAPLTPGSDLGGFTVREIRGVEQGHMRLVCAQGKAVVRLDIALADADPDGGDAPSPPATAGRYAIFYSLRGGATPDDGDRLSQQLARVVQPNLAGPTPEGMTVFRPGPKAGTEL